MQHAYEQGLVHRDIKPSNLLLDERKGTVKVSDFGLARLGAAWQSGEEGGLTRRGVVLGTADYVPPEQVVESRAADAPGPAAPGTVRRARRTF